MREHLEQSKTWTRIRGYGPFTHPAKPRSPADTDADAETRGRVRPNRPNQNPELRDGATRARSEVSVLSSNGNGDGNGDAG